MRLEPSESSMSLEFSDNHHVLVPLGSALELEINHPIHALSPADTSHSWSADEYIRVTDSDYPRYTGAYEANALFSEQIFATANRRMTADFAVHAINYTEAPNGSGITVTIGG